MRRATRLKETEKQKAQRPDEYALVLITVMGQMKQDLTALVDTPEHADYMAFTQQIIHLIKSHNICKVDKFFSVTSREYAPPAQDPGLQVAGILSYGIRLGDVGTKAVAPFFHYVYSSNFKDALVREKAEDQSAILEAGMRNAQVWSFMVSWMIPAIIQTAVRVPYAWLLLDISVGVLERWFKADGVHRELGQEVMGDLLALFSVVYGGIRHLQTVGERVLQPEEVHTLVQMLKLVNLFGPSIAAYLFNDGTSRTGRDLRIRIKTFTELAQAASDYLGSLLRQPGQEAPLRVESLFLFEAVGYSPSETGLEGKPQIEDFSRAMTEDIEKHWEREEHVVSIMGPGKLRQEAHLPQWDMRKLATELLEQAQKWSYAHGGCVVARRRKALSMADEACLF